MSLWIVGGQQRAAFDRHRSWEGYELAVVARVTDDGQVERVFEYRSRPAVTPERDVTQLFTASTIAGNTIYLCAPTEIVVCTFPGFAPIRTISLPCFNDLHHVTLGPDNTVYVAVTGLDAVAELTLEGELLRLVSTLDEVDVWQRFSPGCDYRKCATTKPHASHPNYVFFVDGRACVTRFEQQDAIFLDDRTTVAKLPAGGHDGCAVGDDIYFTTVDGRIVRVNPARGESTSLDLNEVTRSAFPLGWCRGILVEGSEAWVGFSRLRFSRFRKNLSWMRRGFRPSYVHHNPTRIVRFDLERRRLLCEVDLETHGINAVFSILRG
jgi:hypothetical protein